MTHHDFQRAALGWGRSFNLVSEVAGSEILVGLLHATPGPRVGDTCVWTTSYGSAFGEFTKVEPLHDPPDQYRAAVRVQRRYSEDGSVLPGPEDARADDVTDPAGGVELPGPPHNSYDQEEGHVHGPDCYVMALNVPTSAMVLIVDPRFDEAAERGDGHLPLDVRMFGPPATMEIAGEQIISTLREVVDALDAKFRAGRFNPGAN